jgi:hypothetical protein
LLLISTYTKLFKRRYKSLQISLYQIYLQHIANKFNFMYQIEINLVFLQRIYAEIRNMILGKRYYYVLIVRLKMDLVQLPPSNLFLVITMEQYK